MLVLQISATVGGIQTQLRSATGLDVFQAGLGFGVHASQPYFAPSGAAGGEQAVLSVNLVTGGLRITGGVAQLAEVGAPRTIRSRTPEPEALVHVTPRTVRSRGPRPGAPAHTPLTRVTPVEMVADAHDPRPRPAAHEPINANAGPVIPEHISPVPITSRAPKQEPSIHTPPHPVTSPTGLPDATDPRPRVGGTITAPAALPDMTDRRPRRDGSVTPPVLLADQHDLRPRKRHLTQESE